MNKVQFWSIIDKAKASSQSRNGMFDLLVDELSLHDTGDIFLWNRILNLYLSLAYKRRLWAVGHIINGWYSDDGFEYFRCWLISQGKEVFLNALHDPDSLAVASIRENHNAQFESLLYVAFRAYNKRYNLDEDDRRFLTSQ